MYKKILLASIVLTFNPIIVEASDFGVGVFGQFESLDKYHGSNTDMGLGLNLSYEVEPVTLHAIIYKSATMDALWKSDSELGYSDIVVEAEYNSFGIAVSKSYSILDDFNVYAVVGILRTEYDKELKLGNEKGNRDDSETPLFGGLGVNYEFGRNWKASAEINTGYSELVESGSIQIGVSYHF